MTLRVLPFSLVVALAFVVAGCGDSSSSPRGATADSTATGATTGGTTTEGSHASPDLEAVLPAKVGDADLTKGSATGADVFGDDAFSRSMRRFLRGEGKRPNDLEFANARDASEEGNLEVGAFRVRGVEADALRKAIVAASRPNAPGLQATPTSVGGKDVTAMTYPGGSRVYLYEGDGVVFYVGTTDEALAARALEALP